MMYVVQRDISRCCCFFFQAEDGIRDLVRSRGLGDVYKRQIEKARENANDIRNAIINLREEKDLIISKLKAIVSLSLIHI